MKRIGPEKLTPTERTRRARKKASGERNVMLRTLSAIYDADSLNEAHKLARAALSLVIGFPEGADP